MKNILLLMGGGATEHDISIKSAKYIVSQIDAVKFNIIQVEIDKDHRWIYKNQECELRQDKNLHTQLAALPIAAVIPCIHGYPGETGDIQSFLEILNIPYFGCNSEASVICFNKLLTKLVLENENIQTAPFIQVQKGDGEKAHAFLKEYKSIYVKATNQGSSVGCYHVTESAKLNQIVTEAFKFSPFVILEKDINARELEIAAFECDDKVHITAPGEIICPGNFYTYDEKYAADSKTQTITVAPDIPSDILKNIQDIALATFTSLKIRHLCRIDIFLTQTNEIFVNEVNTFPGHTDISMFPSMMENHGVKYRDFINQHLTKLVEN